MKDIKNKNIKVRIDHIFPIEQTAEAQILLESRKAIGKIIIKVT